MGFSIAIDGPGGSGKSTVAKLLAAHYGYIYVDTGAMYRAVALHCQRSGINPQDALAVALAVKEGIKLEINFVNQEQRIMLNGEDVTGEIRTQEAAQGASTVAKFPFVREWLVNVQRSMSKGGSIVMDGRDIGTVVLPGADVKIYLDASVDSRAERRCAELYALGRPCDFEVIRKEIEDRDYNDMNREVSPLRRAEDAVLIDTSAMNREEVKGAIIAIVERKRG